MLAELLNDLDFRIDRAVYPSSYFIKLEDKNNTGLLWYVPRDDEELPAVQYSVLLLPCVVLLGESSIRQ